MSLAVIGWTSAYLSDYPTEVFTEERRKALVDRIRKRKYSFTYNDHQFLEYTAPFYDDETICVLTKQQWDSVIEEVYRDIPCSARLLPEDAINLTPVNGVLYEKEKFIPKIKEN